MLRSVFSTGQGRTEKIFSQRALGKIEAKGWRQHPFSSVVTTWTNRHSRANDARNSHFVSKSVSDPPKPSFSLRQISTTCSAEHYNIIDQSLSHTRQNLDKKVGMSFGSQYPEVLGLCWKSGAHKIPNLATVGPFQNLSPCSSTPLRSNQPINVRWFSSGDGSKNSGKSDGSLDSTSSKKSSSDTGKKEAMESTGKEEASKEGDEKMESMDPRAFLLGTRQQLKKVTEWEVGDMLATYSIAVLLLAIVLSPIVANYMRRSESTYDEMDTDDQVADMSRILRRDFFDKISEDGSIEDKGAVDFVLADVLSSKALQEQAIKFVVSIVQSEEVKKACQNLLKELWNDLVKDPETTAQVIYLLHVAIQNEDIRLATKKLVLEIVEDEEVLEELVRMLRKLGQDKEVLDATQLLLTQSAHNALNDPEILDHSMEFATDVVGDDVVQRSAGEALRNSLSYAVQPGISIVLASIGVGLLFFSVMSLGYARSSDQDAAVLDQAVSGLARSLQPNSRVVDRLWKMLSAPANAVLAITSYVISTVLFPFRQTSSAVGRALDAARMAILESYRASISWIACNADAIATYFGRNGKAVESSLRAAASWISRNLEAIVSFFAHYGGAVSNAVRGVAAFLFNAPGAGKAWVSRVVETIASFFEMFGDTFDGFLQGILAWLARFEDTLSRRGCSLMANPGVSSAVENISLLFRSCQQVITSFAVWFTAANLNKTDKGT